MIDFRYRPDVDGLRAVAVVLVLLFHADLGFSGGYIGVDVFFVISGFLITGLILKEQKTDQFRLSRFWIRRIRRILPASMLVVFTTLVVGGLLLFPGDYEKLALSAISQQLMLSNVFFWRNTGYFDGPAELNPLLHMWSLAVEEQFYVVYPFLLTVIRRFSTRTNILILIGLTSISFGISEIGVRLAPNASFFLLPTRAWEMLLGGLLCFCSVPRWMKDWHANTLGLLGIAGILLAGFLYDSSTRFPGVAAVLPCASAGLLIFSNSRKQTKVGQVLASRAFVGIGLISYSLYLWHWPILSFSKYVFLSEPPSRAFNSIALVASFALAYLSWRFVETPFRKQEWLANPRTLLKATTVAVVLILAISISIHKSQGFPQRIDRRAITYLKPRTTAWLPHQVSIDDVRNGSLPTFGDPKGTVTCLLWGDSHAQAVVPGIDAACKSIGVLGFQATYSNTPPLLDFDSSETHPGQQSPEFGRAVVDFAISHQIDFVLVTASWQKYSQIPSFEECFDRTVRELNEAGIVIAVLKDVAAQIADPPTMLARAVERGLDPEKIGVPSHVHDVKQRMPNAVFEKHRKNPVVLIDPAVVFVDENGLWRAELDGKSMYRDAGHLFREGALRLVPVFEKLLDSFLY